MPDPIVSQFDRKYNAPIETYREVATTTDRNNIASNIRWEGMLVYVRSEGLTYELKEGTDNTKWVALTGLPDAPADGEFYGRKDNAWEILPSVNQTTGDFTAQVVDSGGGAVYSVGSQDCKWVKIGNIRLITVDLNGITKDSGTASGQLQITGMPGTPDGFQVCAAEVSGSNVDHTAAFSLAGSGGVYTFLRKTGATITQYQSFPAPDSVINFRIRFNFAVIED